MEGIMAQAKKGDKVRIHYIATIKDGTVLDSSHGKELLEFTIGQKKIFPNIQNAVIGMKEGETKTFSIQPESAYGNYRKDLKLVISRNQIKIPPDIDPQPGMELQISVNDGQTARATILDINEKVITLDGNHPLAGKEIFYKIVLLEIVWSF